MKKDEMDSSWGVLGVALSTTGLVSALGSPLVGLILSIIGLSAARKQKHMPGSKWDLWGKKLGVIGIIVNILLLVVSIIATLRLIQTGASPWGI